jgi:hypothetical protein
MSTYNESRNDIQPSTNFTPLLTIAETGAIVNRISALEFQLTIPNYQTDSEEIVQVSDVLSEFSYRLLDETEAVILSPITVTGQVATAGDALIITAPIQTLANIGPHNSVIVEVKWQTIDDSIIQDIVERVGLTIACTAVCDVRKQITLVEVGTPLKWQGAYVAPITTANQVIINEIDGASVAHVVLSNYSTSTGKLQLDEDTVLPEHFTVDNAEYATAAGSIQPTSGSAIAANTIQAAVNNYVDKRLYNVNNTLINGKTINKIVFVAEADLPSSRDANTLYLVY